MIDQLQSLDMQIKEKQAELSLLMQEGSSLIAEQVEREIDALQKKYEKVKSGKLSYQDEDDRSNVLPFLGSAPEISLDDQINYMEKIVNHKSVAHINGINSAIYQSLLAARMMYNSIPDSGRSIPVSEAEEIIKTIPRPFDLQACTTFINRLKARVSNPKNPVERELLALYNRLEENLYVCAWVGQSAADSLKREPDNQPRKNEFNEFSSYVKWLNGKEVGSFEEDLFKAYSHTSDDNREAITDAFPDLFFEKREEVTNG